MSPLPRAVPVPAVEWASAAARVLRATELFADGHQLGVIIVVQFRIGGQGLHERGLELFVRRCIGCQVVAMQDAMRIGVDDKARFPQGIEEDRIRGLGTDPFHCQELLAQDGKGAGGHACRVSIIPFEEIPEEMAEAFRLDVEIARGSDEFCQLVRREVVEAPGVQHSGTLQIGDRLRHVAPVRVLREDRADHHLEWRLAGPPMLVAEMPVGAFVGLEEESTTQHHSA